MQPKLDELVPLAAYAQPRSHLFASPTSLQWFVRIHKRELIAAKALLLLAGRWTVNPSNFDAVVVRAGHDAAARRAGPVVLGEAGE